MSKSTLVPGSKRASNKTVAKSAFGFQTKKVRDFFTAKSYFKVGLAYAAIAFLVFGQLLIPNTTTKVAQANAGNPATISVTYNTVTHVLNASGTYTDAPCNGRLVGFALFLNGAVPDAVANSLDPIANTTGTPCSTNTTISGTWSESHILAEAPQSACVVIYDVHVDKNGHPVSGALVSDGNGDNHVTPHIPKRNTDNSYETNDFQLAPSACTPQIITPPGSVTIIQNSIPDNAQSFSFSGDLNSFNLTDNGGANSQLFSNLVPGSYDVTQSAIPGWDLTNLVCDDSDSSVSISGSSVSIHLDPDEHVTCTFTDTKRGKIIIEEQTIPSSAHSFDFTDAGLTPDSFSLSDNGTRTFDDLIPGTFSVSETSDSDYTTTAVCDDGSLVSSINVQAGETVTCVFTNVIKKGGITVVKQTLPSSDNSTVFTFQPDENWNDGSTFTLTGNNSQKNFDLDPGTYSVTENSTTGWDKTSASCIDESAQTFSPDNIVLNPEGSVTCTFVNSKHGQLVVNKITDPQQDPTEFNVTAHTGDGNVTGGQAVKTVSSASPATYEVSAGHYTVTEDVPAGWSQIGNTCSTAVSVIAGATVECTITNVKKGHIIVDKVTHPSGDAQNFLFTTTGEGYNGFSLKDQDIPNSQELLPGSYSVSEVNPLHWNLTGLTCFSGENPTGTPILNGENLAGEQITLAAGQNVFCTFTNTKQIIIQTDPSIVKTVDNPTPARGDTIVYTITVSNDSSVEATNIEVEDTMPASVSYQFDDASASGSITSFNSPILTWNIPTISANGHVALNVTAKVDMDATGPLTNTAEITDGADQGDLLTTNDIASADIEIKTACTSNCDQGPTQYTLTITKSGDGNGTVEGSTGQGGEHQVFCSSTECHADNNEQHSFVGTYNAGTIINLDAIHNSESNFDHSWSTPFGTQGAPANCTTTNTPCSFTLTGDTTINANFTLNPTGCTSNCGGGGGGGGSSPILDLAITKIVSNANPTVGANVTYTITVTNNGPYTAVNTVANDTIPAGTSLVSSVVSTGTFTNGVWTIGNMNVGASATMTLVVTVNAPGTIVNTATVTNSVSDSNLANNTASASLLAGEVAGAFITAPTPQVAGATTLPRTGASNGILNLAGLLVLALIALGINMSFNLKTSEKKA